MSWEKLVKIFDSWSSKFLTLKDLKVNKMVKNFLRLQKAPKVPKKPKIIFLLASNPQMQPWPTWAYFMS